MYRERLEKKAGSITARISAAPGMGAPIRLDAGPETRTLPCHRDLGGVFRLFASGKATMGAIEFLRRYRDNIEALPALSGAVQPYLTALSREENVIFTTLLPSMAAVKRRFPDLDIPEVVQAVREYCTGELDAVLRTMA
jgi:hypothetical protein